MRVVTGLHKPRMPGFRDFGITRETVAEAVGTDVARFRPGDGVFGVCHGACAEYACTRQDQLALKPTNLTWAGAASGTDLGSGRPARGSRHGEGRSQGRGS